VHRPRAGWLHHTDDKSLDKVVRKKLQVEHASAKSDRAKFIKLADKTSNLRSLVKSPPDDWSVQRRQEYLDWALAVAKGLRGTNLWLEAQFDDAAKQLAASCAQTTQLGEVQPDRYERSDLEEKLNKINCFRLWAFSHVHVRGFCGITVGASSAAS
jgi:hypothetical protein